MDFEQVLSNRPIPIQLLPSLREAVPLDDTPKLILIGDLLLDASYGETALVITDRRVVCVADSETNEVFSLPLEEVWRVRVRRMYGSALLRINHRSVFRCTLSVVTVLEAVAAYLEALSKKGNPDQALEAVHAELDKERTTCPNCGRTLIRPGAVCVHCMNKRGLLKRLWGYVAPKKGLLFFSIGLSVVTTAMTLVPPYVTKTLVDDIIPKQNRAGLFWLVGLLVAVNAVLYGGCCLRRYFMQTIGNRLLTVMRNDIYEKAQYLPVRFFDKTSTGSIFSRIDKDVATVRDFTMNLAQEGLVQVITLVGILLVMLSLNWRLTLLSLIPVPVIALGSRFFQKKIRPIYQRAWLKHAAITSTLSDTLPGVRVIKAFTGEKRAVKRFSDCTGEWLEENNKAVAASNIFPHLVAFLVTCGSLMIWWVGGCWVMDAPETTSLGLLVSFISYTSMFYGPVNFFAGLSDGYQQTLTCAERLLDILDAEPEHDFGKGNVTPSMEGRIEFRHVSFSFDRGKRTLEDINLVIEPGDVVGIVGTTGSGKSTLINLLMRFYDEYEGEILVDGQDIRTIDLEYYRGHIGYVQQEPLMFHDTVFRNIAFSNPEASVEQVMHAADVANAHEFIVRLPDGYDTILGERGTGLSGGERQRLSIARAMMKKPSLLIFDEATASVDSETEQLIQEAIERLIHGRTTLMVAHRLSTLSKANKIVVVDQGRIIECGTPEELLAQKGKYYRLLQIQNKKGDGTIDLEQ